MKHEEVSCGGPVTKPPGPGLDDTALMTLLVAHKAG